MNLTANTLRVSMVVVTVAICGAMPGQAEVTGWQQSFAERMYEAWKSGAPKPQLSKAHSAATLSDAYAIQRIFVRQLASGDGIGGYKAAVTGAKGQAGLWINGPLTAVVPASGIMNAGSDVVIDLADEPVRFLETEVGFVFGNAIDAPVADVATLKRHVKHVVAAIEVPGGASENADPVTAADLVARNIDSIGVILGPREASPELDVDGMTITLSREGATVNEARGDMAVGGQWETLRKTVNALVAQGYTIEAGQFITNGALGSIQRAKPGVYRADYGPLGAFTFTVKEGPGAP